ncbi:hypothetical protein [Acinetobacter sp.]|uniref:hypothetical protein n=1 Tax=Acinetobacter sp. TaxID=472 RepID=UPI003CFC0303
MDELLQTIEQYKAELAHIEQCLADGIGRLEDNAPIIAHLKDDIIKLELEYDGFIK